MSKKKKKTTARRSLAFDRVEGGYVSPKRNRPKKIKPQDDLKNAWDRGHLGVLPSLPSGHYVIWLAATDVDGHTSKTGPSACAWRIRGEGVEITEPWPGDARESSEKKAYVAAVAGALDRLPTGSSAEIICREDYIVDAINFRLKTWRAELGTVPGEKYPRRQYGLIWLHVLVTIERIKPPLPGLLARHPKIKGDADDKIIEELKKMIRGLRPLQRK